MKIKLWLVAAGGMVAILLGVFALGWTRRGDKEKLNDVKAEVKTHERMEEAEQSADADAARDWLRKR